jgi:hypothetical protein
VKLLAGRLSFTPGEDKRGLLYRFEGRGRSAAYWPAI